MIRSSKVPSEIVKLAGQEMRGEMLKNPNKNWAGRVVLLSRIELPTSPLPRGSGTLYMYDFVWK